MNTKNTVIWAAVAIVLVIAVIYVRPHDKQVPADNAASGNYTLLVKATFACDSGKTIRVSFYKGPSIPSSNPNLPPTPGGKVELSLSDGRNMSLPQTLSADGGRYANADESIIFWNVGSGGFLEERGTQVYSNCELLSDK